MRFQEAEILLSVPKIAELKNKIKILSVNEIRDKKVELFWKNWCVPVQVLKSCV